MKTVWGECLRPDAILTEYPRPQLRRESYLNLNGPWEYAITDTDTQPETFDGTILVPFSPEAPLSGVERTLGSDQFLWYRRSVILPEGFVRDRTFLHFGAVDQEAAVFVNGRQLAHHSGGYLPFTCDVTDALQGGREMDIVVCVRDVTDESYHTRGKQRTARGGIWYTPQSGIWQTVWMESLPKTHIRGLRITPLFDEAMVELRVQTSVPCACVARLDGRTITFCSGTAVRVPMPGFHAWSPEDPFLYDLQLEAGDDRVESYFAMRGFSVQTDADGLPRLCLNGRPYFHTGVLDQGYWPDGLYTAPSDEAMVFDIALMKRMGFNLLRKHIKIEPLRWYYHCDRLGMLVWQDMPNGGGEYLPLTISAPLLTGRHRDDHDYVRFARQDAAGRREFLQELDAMVEHLYNCPCIAMWVPFNEGWGQFEAREAAERIRALDPTRTVDHASGWHDQGAGDVKSLHVYFRAYRHRQSGDGRAVVLSEFGGYNHRVQGHAFNRRDFGYRRYRTAEKLRFAIQDLYVRQIIPAKAQGLSAAVYTQLSDVEDELNGLVTYDRAVVKMEEEAMLALNEALRDDLGGGQPPRSGGPAGDVPGGDPAGGPDTDFV